jgi:hypothetical protein
MFDAGPVLAPDSDLYVPDLSQIDRTQVLCSQPEWLQFIVWRFLAWMRS